MKYIGMLILTLGLFAQGNEWGADMMKKMMWKMATPDGHHQLLAQMEGSFVCKR